MQHRTRLTFLSATLMLAACHPGPARVAAAADDVVLARRPAHWYAPPGADGPLIDYDLDAECDENTRRQEARQVFNTACFTLRSYVEAYHAGTTFAWQRPARGAFRFVGTAMADDGTHDEISVRWASISDGLQWGFEETRLTRWPGSDPFTVVADAAARDRIRAALGPETGGRPCDVFRERVRAVVTDQRRDGIPFPPAAYDRDRYGVCIDGGVRFFTPAGEPLPDKARAQ